MTIDIADFIDARITEDEATARAAMEPYVQPGWTSAGTWEVHGPDNAIIDTLRNDACLTVASHAAWGSIDERHAVHVARHDPARVLRESAARRRTLERHQPIDIDSTGRGPCLRCAHCLPAGVTTWPCPDVADLADTWPDHDSR